MNIPSDNNRDDLLPVGTPGNLFPLEIAGNSMIPTFYAGSIVVVEHKPKETKLGDIVLFSQNSILTAHRVVRTKRIENILFLQTKGDNSLNFDPQLIKKDDIAGKVIGIMRNKDILFLETGWWRLYGCVLALYSYCIATSVKVCKILLKPINRNKKNNLTPKAGKLLLAGFSIIPRSISFLFRFKSDKKG